MELVDGRVSIREEQGRLEDILKRHLDLDSCTLIKCGSILKGGPLERTFGYFSCEGKVTYRPHRSGMAKDHP